MIETALIFDREGKTLRFFEPPGRSAGYIPDIQATGDMDWEDRFDQILFYYVQENAGIIGGIAHTHPWDGPAAPSSTDLRTFRVLDSLVPGRNLLYPVVTFTDIAWITRNVLTNECVPVDSKYITFTLEGLEELRKRSRTGSEEFPCQ